METKQLTGLILSLFAIALLLLDCVYGQAKVTQSEDGSSGTISFSTPDLHDDEAHSPWMPDQLKCDACKGVSYQIWKAFWFYNEKVKSKKFKLPESEIMTITEKLCTDDKTWEGYGIKLVKKRERLSGEGMEHSQVPGVTAGGGKWPQRMADMCEQYMGQVGELPIYKVFKKNPQSTKRLENYLCRGKGIRNECIRAERLGKDEL